MDSLVVNLFAGPCGGKSTMAANIFCALKMKHRECELVTEFAKDLTWEDCQHIMADQLYLLGEQHHRVFRLVGKVEVIITDSPIIQSIPYGLEWKQHKALALEAHHKFNNLNIFLERVHPYNPHGRNQTLEEAVAIGEQTLDILKDHNIEYMTVPASVDSVNEIITEIELRIKS